MTVLPLDGSAPLPPETLDVPLASAARPPDESATFAESLAKAFGDAGTRLERAAQAERAFARGSGGLQEMILERAQADVVLAIAGAAASRTTQAVSTILGMQV